LALRRQIKEAADALVQQAREEVDPLVRVFYSEAARPVGDLEARVLRLTADRERLSAELADLERRSRQALSRAANEREAALKR
jgi:hypothetical protein